MVRSSSLKAPEGFLAECEVDIAAAPDTVFEFLIDEQKFLMWQGIRAEFDPRPGGKYLLEVTPGWVAEGEFTEVDPPRAVAFTWGWSAGESPVPPGGSLVRITLEPIADGTRVTLVHSGLPDEAALAGHSEGWVHYLERLEVVATGRDAGRDPWLGDQ